MAASERTAKQRLTRVRDLLARASRNRETNRLVDAERVYLAAERELAAYDAMATRGMLDEINEGLRRTVEAERLLVYAMLYAHRDPAHAAIALFDTALAATGGLPGYFRGRVLCCWGVTLLFYQQHDSAIAWLEQARTIFDREHRRDEYVQATYHLARALVQCRKRDEAIAVLRQIVVTNVLVIAATRYTIAAMTLLATLLWFKGKRDEARRIHCEALQRARANNLYQTVEYDHLLIIRRFGFLVYAMFPGKPLWPEI